MAHSEIATSPQREEQQSSPDSQMKLARRQLLTTGAVATAAALLPGSGTAEARPPVKAVDTNTFPQPAASFS